MLQNKALRYVFLAILVAAGLTFSRASYTPRIGDCLQWTGPTVPERRNITVYLLEIKENGDIIGRVCYNDLYHRRHCESAKIDDAYLPELKKCDIFRRYE